jgi:hypothetical protein
MPMSRLLTNYRLYVNRNRTSHFGSLKLFKIALYVGFGINFLWPSLVLSSERYSFVYAK